TVCSGSRIYTGRFHPRGHHHGREPDARAPRAGRSDAVVLTEWRHEGPLRTIASPGRGARPCSGDSDRLIFRIGRRSLARRLPRSSISSRIRMRRTRAAQRRRARVLANPKNPSVATPCPQSTIRLRDRRGVATAVDPSTPSRARCSTMVVHPMPPRRRELLLQVRNYVPLAAVGLIATVTWVVLVEPAELSKPPSPRPSNEQLEPERELSVAERFELPSTPTHIRHIGPDDVQVMPVREVTIEGDTTPYEVGTLPKGQKLLTGKNLWLAGPFPVATDRVVLSRTSQASEFSPALRAQLVDLQTGAILGTYDRVYHQYRTFGVAWGREKDPSSGETRRVLIHVSDGLAVPVEDFGA